MSFRYFMCGIQLILEYIIMAKILNCYTWCMLTPWILITGGLTRSRWRGLLKASAWDLLFDSVRCNVSRIWQKMRRAEANPSCRWRQVLSEKKKLKLSAKAYRVYPSRFSSFSSTFAAKSHIIGPRQESWGKLLCSWWDYAAHTCYKEGSLLIGGIPN